MPFRRTIHQNPLQHGLSFGKVRQFTDSNLRGAHALVPHAKFQVCKDGLEVGWVDVHLHHNQCGFSAGVTVGYYTARIMSDPDNPGMEKEVSP